MAYAPDRGRISPLETRISVLQSKIKELLNDIQNLNSKNPYLEEAKQSIVDRLRTYETDLSRLRGDTKGKKDLPLRVEQIGNSLTQAQRAFEAKQQSLAKKEAKAGTSRYTMSPEEIEAEKARAESDALLQQQATYHAAVLQDREEQFKEIHRDIVLVREATQDMNQMLNEQTDSLLLVESNTYSAEQNTGEAASQLKAADKYDRKSKTKLCCVFFIVIVVLAVIAIILSVTLTKKK